MKIQIEKENRFVYPDAVVVCEVPEYYNGRKDTIPLTSIGCKIIMEDIYEGIEFEEDSVQ